MIHEHHQWLEDVNKSVVESYERDQAMARQPDGIQRTGHRVESRWDEVLSDWLPPQYEIGKRKYLLLETEDGPAVTKETDLVVFYPHYPEKLRTKESVLASGVAAAFSVKRTIKREAIVEAYEDAAILRQGMKIRELTPRNFLAPPVFFGLLGESHGWKSAADPKDTIKTIVDTLDMENVKAPREGLDMLCIADLGYWGRSTSIVTEQFLQSQADPMISALLGKESLVISGLRHDYNDPQPLSPLTHFIGSLWAKLAINDPTLTPLADGFRITKTFPAGGGLAFKRWRLVDLTTQRIADNVRRGFIPNSDWQYLF
ncbi:conserved hypothetical protein [uncultured Mycobacterium sp.]|uniref:DUF6602 domain-containing protein n=1 Tax=uncultured Mycobacterium sp. TaxID=171292 RepID=A0A1Y5PJU4_9MYCO|nr:conserved hypothetical protein [uncultured Mycobacterium sp.]